MQLDDNTRTLLSLVAEHDWNVAARFASFLGASVRTSNRRLSNAVDLGLLRKHGTGRGVSYSIIDQYHVQQEFERATLLEDHVWNTVMSPTISDLPETVRDIWRYGFIEVVNNAIDHSAAASVSIGVIRNPLYTQVRVSDDGEGIFLKIQKALKLHDPRDSILELAKGKFTTAPEKHFGDGIFFSSKMFDYFDICSGDLHFTCATEYGGRVSPVSTTGTTVAMRLLNDSVRTTNSIFDEFAVPSKCLFAKTIVPVRLGQYEGEKLVSRSQAKRLIFRLEEFKTVVLDFSGVAEIGQAFSDEVFRVFQNECGETELVPVNMTAAVKNMVLRAKKGGN